MSPAGRRHLAPVPALRTHVFRVEEGLWNAILLHLPDDRFGGRPSGLKGVLPGSDTIAKIFV